MKNPAQFHKLRIAKRTLRMPDAILGVMGGPTKEEAAQTILNSGQNPFAHLFTPEQNARINKKRKKELKRIKKFGYGT